MKTTRNLLRIWLLCTAMLPAAVQAQFIFTTNNDGSLNIAGYTGSGGVVIIPSTTNSPPITSIGAQAFVYNVNVSSVVIPNSVTSIGASAFYDCTSLTNVTIGAGVTNIGNEAFYGCPTLTNVTIPASVTSIGSDAFGDCLSLTAISVNAGNPAYSSVSGVLFNQSQTALVECPGGLGGSYTIPASVSSIGSDAFANCTTLTGVVIFSTVTNIGNEAFYGCPSLTAITVDPINPAYSSDSSGVLFDKSQATLIECPGGLAGSYAIPASVSTIASNAFYSCYALTGVTIGTNNVTSIGDEAFYDCIKLTGVTIGTNVTSIGDEAFYGCPSLTAITVNTNNPAYSSAGGVLFNQSQTTLIECPGGMAGSYTIPASVTSLGNNAFSSCYGLTNVTILAGVTNIGNEAFHYCTELTSVAIPASLTSIGCGVFAGCYVLTNVTIPGSVTSIGNQAFSDCPSLTQLTIGYGVTTIGQEAFSDCTGLAGVSIPFSVNSIGAEAFANCTTLSSVTIFSTVTNIGDQAFTGCTSLTAITVDPSNPDYSSVDGVLFDGGQTTLVACPGGLAGSYTIPASVTSIGDHAFYGCADLSSIKIPASVTNIGNYAFYGCTGLTSISLPNSVASIGDFAFQFCAGLTSMTIPASVTSLGSDAFYYCTSLTSVSIPNSVTSIGSYAFELCTSLTSVTNPASVTSLGDWGFSGCFSLTAAYFKGNAPGADSTVFACDNNPTVYYLPGTTGWGPFLTEVGLPGALWYLPNPLILNNEPGFGVQTNGFSFLISWATNISVVVQACTNLASPVWQPVATNTLAAGSSYFSDPQWTNYPGRFYRVGSQ